MRSSGSEWRRKYVEIKECWRLEWEKEGRRIRSRRSKRGRE